MGFGGAGANAPVVDQVPPCRDASVYRRRVKAHPQHIDNIRDFSADGVQDLISDFRRIIIKILFELDPAVKN